MKKEKEALAAGAITIEMITSALRAASEEQMSAFLSVIQEALTKESIMSSVPTPSSLKKGRKSSSAADSDASSVKSKKEVSESVLAAGRSWNQFVASVRADLLEKGMIYTKKKIQDLEKNEFNYEFLLKEAGRRNAELKGEEPKVKAPKPTQKKETPPKPKQKKETPPPSTDDEEEEEEEDDELQTYEEDGVEYWVSTENVVYEKLEYGGLGERVGILDADVQILIRD